jgi:hypothetical protein
MCLALNNTKKERQVNMEYTYVVESVTRYSEYNFLICYSILKLGSSSRCFFNTQIKHYFITSLHILK